MEALELLEAGFFRIDHEQTYTSQDAITYRHKSGVWSSLTGGYDSGLPVEIEGVAKVRAAPI